MLYFNLYSYIHEIFNLFAHIQPFKLKIIHSSGILFKHIHAHTPHTHTHSHPLKTNTDVVCVCVCIEYKNVNEHFYGSFNLKYNFYAFSGKIKFIVLDFTSAYENQYITPI